MTRALALLCTVATTLAVAPAATTQTVVNVFNPWAPSGLRQGFTVSENAKGSCWTHSLATDRADAWRCFQGNDIRDPCFAGPRRSAIVACAEGPFSKKIVLLRLGKPFADSESATTKLLQPKGEPWGLRVTSGDTCVFVTGATYAVAGERLNYACARAGWILGAPDRSTDIWTARSVLWPSTLHIKRVDVAVAIF